MEEKVRTTYEKACNHKGFGYYYLKGKINKDETVRALSLYLFGKQAIAIAISDELWVQKNGEPYHIKVDGNTLFIKKLAISIGDIG